MTKLLFATLILSFFAFKAQPALADSTLFPAGPGFNDGNPEFRDGFHFHPGRRPPHRNFQIRWQNLTTGAATNWVISPRPVCGHGAACACGQQNYCGEYGQRQRAYYWERGCDEPPSVIECQVR